MFGTKVKLSFLEEWKKVISVPNQKVKLASCHIKKKKKYPIITMWSFLVV